jgi:uncharacterized protein (TIGR02001 family)
MMKTNKANKVSFSAAKRNLLNALVLAALAVPGVAMAADVETPSHKEDKHVIPVAEHTITANVGFVTDYLYRGISQTGGKPAIQGGFDYARTSGLYAGVWGSNVSWVAASSASLELDTYLGFKNSFAEDFSYDVGFLRYNYPGVYPSGATKADTNEIYGLIGWKWLTLKYSDSLGDTFGVSKAGGSSYIDLSGSYTIEGSGVALGAHYGKQTYKGETADALKAGGADPTYSDYKLSVTKDLSGYVVGLAYSSTNAKKGLGQFYNAVLADGSNIDLGKGTAVLSLTHSF